jgi:hypothetical protein
VRAYQHSWPTAVEKFKGKGVLRNARREIIIIFALAIFVHPWNNNGFCYLIGRISPERDYDNFVTYTKQRECAYEYMNEECWGREGEREREKRISSISLCQLMSLVRTYVKPGIGNIFVVFPRITINILYWRDVAYVNLQQMSRWVRNCIILFAKRDLDMMMLLNRRRPWSFSTIFILVPYVQLRGRSVYPPCGCERGWARQVSPKNIPRHPFSTN